MARGSQHPDAIMENQTPFSLSEAIRRWRAEFGSPSSLSAAELEELEAHLRDHVAQLEVAGMKPEAAFTMAAKRLGDRQRVAGEFAKINPQRIWLERALWMTVGVFLLIVLGRLVLIASNVIYGHGLREWNPVITILATKVFYLGGVTVLAGLLLLVFARRSNGQRALCRWFEQRPFWAGIGMVVVLWGTDRLRWDWKWLLEHCLPRLDAWLFPTSGWTHPDMSLENRIVTICWVAEHILWACAVCMLAASVLRGGGGRSLSPATDERGDSSKRLWVERGLWMVVGCMLVDFIQQNIVGLGFLTVGQMMPVPPRNALLLEQAHDLGLALTQFALWTTSIWIFWILATERPKLGSWIRRTMRDHPFKAAFGLVLLLNMSAVLGRFFFWVGIKVVQPGNSYGYIGPEWHVWSQTLIYCVTPAVLFAALLRQRMKMREANWRCREHRANNPCFTTH